MSALPRNQVQRQSVDGFGKRSRYHHVVQNIRVEELALCRKSCSLPNLLPIIDWPRKNRLLAHFLSRAFDAVEKLLCTSCCEGVVLSEQNQGAGLDPL